MKNLWIKTTCLLSLVILCFSLLSQVVGALSAEQRKIFEGGNYFFDVDPCGNTTANPEGNIYVLGDSLTVGMRDIAEEPHNLVGLEEKLQEQGWEVSEIEATNGFNIELSMPKVIEDEDKIKNSDAVLIGLGTNRDTNFPNKVNRLVNKIREFSDTTNIFWFNTANYGVTRSGYSDAQINRIIQDKSEELDFTVIDWAKEFRDNGSSYPTTGDALHQTPEGYEARAAWTAEQVGEPVAGTSQSSAAITGDGTGTSTGSASGEFIQKINPAPFTGSSIEPTGVTLHWTGGSPDQTVESFIAGISGRGLSVQLYIDGDGNVYQLVDDLATLTAHAADANSKTIGIEIAAGSDGTVETAAREINSNPTQEEAVVNTVAYLVQEYNMQIDPDVPGRKGILSHHLISPDRKSDVGDEYHNKIVEAVRNGGFDQVDSCDAEVVGDGGDPSENQRLGQQLASEKGWTGPEWSCLLELWNRESSWETGRLNKSSFATGIPQALPGTKIYPGPPIESRPHEERDGKLYLADADARVEIEWGLQYIEGRYTTPCAAIAWHDSHNWY